MINSIVKFFIGTLLGIAVALLLAFNVLLLWVASGPRSLGAISHYIEYALEPSSHEYSIKIGETWLVWDGWKHPVDIRLRDVVVLTHDHLFSRFPEISLGLDILSLMEGRLLPTSVTITHPVLRLYQNDDHSISFGFRKQGDPDFAPDANAKQEPTPEAKAPKDIPAADAKPTDAAADDNTVPLAVLISALVSPDSNSNLRKLRTINIVKADVNVGNPHRGIFFKASDADMVFKNNKRGLNVFSSASITYGKYNSVLSAQFSMPKGATSIEGEVSVNEVMPGALVDLFANKTLLSAMKFPIGGISKLTIDTNGVLQKLKFSVDGGKGTLETDRLEGILPINSMHAEGQVTGGGNEIQIDKIVADIDGMLIDADGSVELKDNDPAINANLNLKNIPAERVHMLWPLSLSPMTREWIIKNITKGRITSAHTHVDIKHGDIAKKDLPKEDVDSTIILEGAEIHYLPEHPPLTDTKASIHLDGVSMNASLESARFMKQTKMSNGSVKIDDLNAENPYIKVEFDTETSAKDVVHFLGLPRLKHAKRLNLSEDAAEGSIKGHGAVGFNFFAPHDANGKDTDPDVKYAVTADVKGITQPGFMQRFDIQNASGSVKLDNDAIEFKGSGNVNGANISEATVKYLFDAGAKGAFDTFIEATATAPVESLPRFGYPAFDFLKGKLGVKANLKEGNNAEQSQATIDLTDAVVDWKTMQWHKPDKEPATLTLTGEKKNDVTAITAFTVKGKNLDIHGSAGLNKDLSAIKTVSVDKLSYSGSELDRLEYEAIDGGFNLEAHGNTANLRPWMESNDESTFSFEHFPATHLKIDFKQVVLGKGRNLNGVKGDVLCDIKRCDSANIAGTTIDNKSFNFRILHNPNGKRQLSIHSQSAGAFLKALGIFNGMEGGDLSITGGYNDSGEHNVLTGVADINEHTIKDAPVLANILSLASFTGFFDTLQGKGIKFVKTRAPFTLTKDVITFKDAKTHGDAMGMTMEGTITFPKRTLDFSGTIVPSYTLNHVLGNVPLVGGMLTGGDGGGVFAAKYSITGTDDAPKVSVNPLSILTPGFLRGVFDIFDTPAKDTGEGADDSVPNNKN